MKAIFRQRKSSIEKAKFVPALAKNPSIHPKAQNERSLSPNSKLRILKAKLEAEMRAEKSKSKRSNSGSSFEKFIGANHGLGVKNEEKSSCTSRNI